MAFGQRTKKSDLRTVYDQDGNQIEFDIREDEEQHVKLSQTIDLLLAAGYFRARIKGLSPFDKVVGGMTWCITTCNFDIDVDLLFQENSTIGQKIALTEKIVSVLPQMRCPHRIEPHQIQGLDFIHIFPVVQWLVKKAIETREEMGDYIRAYSVSQFDKNHQMPSDVVFSENKFRATSALAEVKENYRPQRKYKHQQDDAVVEEELRVQSTLLEYGRRYGLSKSKTEGVDQEKEAKKKAAKAGLGDEEDLEKLREEEEKKIEMLMSSMAAMGKQGRLTATAVGSLVGMKAEQIAQIASEYAGKQQEIEAMEKTGKVGGAQHHKRVTAALQKQIDQQQVKLDAAKEKHDNLHQNYVEMRHKLKEAEEYGERINTEMGNLEDLATKENEAILDSLQSLVVINENLKRQEQEFKAHCKEEMTRLQGDIVKLKEEGGESEEDQERSKMIDKQYQADSEKLHKIRLVLARKNREIGGLQRKIDEVPSRAELSQYQRRFVELYNQVAAKHKETKQFYTLYNTLDDTKLYLDKEVSLLNSIHDTFEQAMASVANKEQFLKQFESIVAGVNSNKNKLEKKKQEEKMRRDQLNDKYLDLIENQRLYFKVVKDFKEECRKNEILISKLKGYV